MDLERLADYLRSHSVRCDIKPDHVIARFEYTTKLKYKTGDDHWMVPIRTFKQARLWLGY